jgi:hypothetical protein
MASATSLPLKPILFTTSLVLGIGASRVGLRDLLLKTVTGPGKYKRIGVILFVVANIKNVPFFWHVCTSCLSWNGVILTVSTQYRVWAAILRHCLFSKPGIGPERGPSSLFLPVITTSRSPLYECDYNLHKSNSTYFSDLDITRSHIVCALVQPGIHALQHNKESKLVLDKDGKPFMERWSIMLGSVMCSFKREIGMLEPYEMWSRILCWDRKWIYIVTHFVKKGTVKPKAYILGDRTWFGKKGYKHVRGDGRVRSKEVDEKAIFASAISKYVMKLGRLTIHPEVVLQASDLLPEKPGGWATMSGPSGESTPDVVEEIDTSAVLVDSKSTEWDWRKVEAENKRGLEFAAHFAALDELHHEFTGSQAPALGKYPEGILW